MFVPASSSPLGRVLSDQVCSRLCWGNCRLCRVEATRLATVHLARGFGVLWNVPGRHDIGPCCHETLWRKHGMSQGFALSGALAVDVTLQCLRSLRELNHQDRAASGFFFILLIMFAFLIIVAVGRRLVEKKRSLDRSGSIRVGGCNESY